MHTTSKSGSSLRGEDIVPWVNEPTSFYADRLPDEFEKARARDTDDDTIMGYHTSNCVISNRSWRTASETRTQWPWPWSRHAIGRERVASSKTRVQSPTTLPKKFPSSKPQLDPSSFTNINSRHHFTMELMFLKTEPGCTPRWQKLPALGHHPTFHPGTPRVQKKKKPKHKKWPRQHPLRNIDHLTPEQQVYELKQSRKAIKSRLYGRIARLEICSRAIIHR